MRFVDEEIGDRDRQFLAQTKNILVRNLRHHVSLVIVVKTGKSHIYRYKV
ncbi:MAG TPA: hypothetical protein V6C71_21720 [Coleofasciculaceae cyanobacterium]